jgi:hypothetical protein
MPKSMTAPMVRKNKLRMSRLSLANCRIVC